MRSRSIDARRTTSRPMASAPIAAEPTANAPLAAAPRAWAPGATAGRATGRRKAIGARRATVARLDDLAVTGEAALFDGLDRLDRVGVGQRRNDARPEVADGRRQHVASGQLSLTCSTGPSVLFSVKRWTDVRYTSVRHGRPRAARPPRRAPAALPGPAAR